MEYLIGSLVTLACLLIFLKINRQFTKDRKSGTYRVVYNQSHIYKLIRPYLIIESMIAKADKKTQARDYEASMYVRIIIVDEQAYWIRDNTFFVADMVDGALDNETTRKVDTMAMDEVQLKKMVFIVEKLTEGKQDDRGDSGYSWI